MEILWNLSLGIDILSGLFWAPTILYHSQKNIICFVNCVGGEGVGQNLDKKVKFDLMTGQVQKRSLEAQGLRSLALKKYNFT